MDTEREFKQLFDSQQKSKQSYQRPIYANTGETTEEKLDLSWLFAVILRRLPIMIALGLVFSLTGAFFVFKNSRQIIKEYQGRFRILVEPPTAESRLAQQFLLAQSPGAELDKRIEETSFVDYETLVRVLQSHKLLVPIHKEIEKRYPDLKYETFTSRLKIDRLSYEKDGKQFGTKVMQISYQDKDPKKIIFILKTISEAYITYSLQERLTSINKGIKFIDEQLPQLQSRVDKFQEELEDLRQKNNFFAPEMEGRALSDQASSLYRQKVDNSVELDSINSLYNSLEKQLAMNENATSILMTEGRSYERILSELQGLDSALAQRQAHYRDDSAPVVALEKTRQEMLSLTRRKAEQEVLQKIATQKETLEARGRAIAQEQNLLNQRVGELSATARQYALLDQQIQVASDSLRKFLAKREALQIDAAQQDAPWQVIVPPDLVRNPLGEPIPTTQSQTKRQLMLALVLSTLLGIGIGFLVEALNNVFHTPEEARAVSKLPLLGIIPYAKFLQKRNVVSPEPVLTTPAASGGLDLLITGAGGASAAPAVESVDSSIVEAFRYLYTNIRLLNPQHPIRSFAIGSPSMGDGKTTVAIHLAQTAAAIGQRVLLVDADLRAPKIHTKFGVPNIRGLSDAIVNDMGLNEVIQRAGSVWAQQMPGEENLFVMTAGSPSPDPIKLLSSNKMLYLMEQFQAFFDLVIYDTPPLTGLADGNIIAAHTDGMVLVVSMAKTNRSALVKVMESLKISGALVLGLVANGVKGGAAHAYTKV